MDFVWSERKRLLNLRRHGLDFADAPDVFNGLTISYEDNRIAYYEQRFVTIGMLAGSFVSITHTDTAHETRIISFRKATKREIEIYLHSIQD